MKISIINLDDAYLAAREKFLASVKAAIATLTAEFEKHGTISKTKEFHLSKTPPGSYDVVGSVEYRDKLSTHELKLNVEFHHDATASITIVLFKNTDGAYVSTSDFSHTKIKGKADDILDAFMKHVRDYVSLIETGKIPDSVKKMIEKYQ